MGVNLAEGCGAVNAQRCGLSGLFGLFGLFGFSGVEFVLLLDRHETDQTD
jgi:hypothetical protein